MALEKSESFQCLVSLYVVHDEVIAIWHVQLLVFLATWSVEHVEVRVFVEVALLFLALAINFTIELVLVHLDFGFIAVLKQSQHFFVFLAVLDADEPIILDLVLCHEV